MRSIVIATLDRIQPRPGWLSALLALCCVMLPGIAATQSTFALPAGALAWLGAAGLAVGLDSVPRGDWQSPRWLYVLRTLVHAAVWLAGIGVAILWAGQALAPLGLILADLGALRSRLAEAGAPEAADRTWRFLLASTARLATDLQTAPSSGAGGATLLLAVLGGALAWVSGISIGRGLASAGSFFLYIAPLIVTLLIVAVVADAGGWVLAFGTALMVMLTAVVTFDRRRRRWENAGLDYSSELTRDVVVWAGITAALALFVAWVVPLWPGNPLAQALQRQGSPSGLAALERGMAQSVGPNPTVDIGLSTLPTVPLGVSLAEGPPDQLALRVRVQQPLPGGPVPHYWRARILNRYNGTLWYADARINPQPAGQIPTALDAGQIVQQVEDLRPDRTLIIGLATIQAVDVPASFEYFEDGSQAAVTGLPPVARYQVLSRLQEDSLVTQLDREPPDLSAYLGIPRQFPVRVGELATSIAGAEPTAMTKALALEAFLRHAPYTYEVERIPEGGDAVDQFLFEMRSGYCTYYASAMAMMARTLGIPARVAIGYSTGVEESPGTYVVREIDAHAWPELYINGRWVAFEPTPIRPLPERTPSEQQEPDSVAVTAPEPDRTSGPLIWAALAVVLIGLSMLLWRVARRPAPPSPEVRALIALERCGERLGIAWPAGATIQEYSRLLERHVDGAAPALRELVAIVQRARYGKHALDGNEQQRLAAAEQQVAQAGPIPRR